MRFAVTFPEQTIEVDASDALEAACAAAYELARQCEAGTLAQIVRAQAATQSGVFEPPIRRGHSAETGRTAGERGR